MRNLDREEVKSEILVFHVMGMRGDMPQWVIKTDRTTALYRSLYALKLPKIQVQDMERLFLIYVRTDEEATQMFRLLGSWPRTFWFKGKILRYLAATPNELPLPV